MSTAILTPTLQASTYSETLHLGGGARTTIHIARYRRDEVQPRFMAFNRPTRLLTWCRREGIEHAMSGGFFVRDSHQVLGEAWIKGVAHPSVPFAAPWHANRGSIHMATDGTIELAARDQLPAMPNGDLLQAGPLLVQNGRSLVSPQSDPEGFSVGAHQFDSDITAERHPRAAIAIDSTYIYSVVNDGRSATEAGLYLHELADYLVRLDVTDALNLDGGSSATLISSGQLINTPRGISAAFPEGRGIHTALIFRARTA